MAGHIRESNCRNGNRRRKTKTCSSAILQRSRSRRVFDTLEGTGEDKDYKTSVEKITAHFNPQVNTTYEVFNFSKAQQNEGESLNSFHTRLRTLAKTCEFADADREIKEQIQTY